MADWWMSDRDQAILAGLVERYTEYGWHTEMQIGYVSVLVSSEPGTACMVDVVDDCLRLAGVGFGEWPRFCINDPGCFERLDEAIRIYTKRRWDSRA